ncbi:aminotransferase class V-fold PLP-dependent enzyme [Lacrimispora sp.]|jgi:cysteine desulfurase family protein|uniref:aminotransferase class V-fold PLP-dependent enzyme n=1 Tax=Lacrimispora sp. TaxID=2719234 RepID=UPI00289666B9|nr:aminotransferase class V-fold PLP-dependent enzyme [Lacrimispora sp.]
MIYLDNAATSCQKPEEVIKAVTEAMLSLGNSGRGAHEASLDASRLIFDTRRLIAELFHAGDPSCVAFTANSTVSLNIAIQGLFQPGDHVITTMMEHNSVLRPLYLMEEQGVKLTILPADQKGRIRYEDIEDEVGQNTKAVVCTHASNLTGNINDLEAIGRICKKNGLLLVVDVSQTAGVFDIDMERMGIHVLCFTGHKGLLGPQGTGGICVRQGVSIRPLMVGGSGVKSYLKTQPEEMPEVLEAGTLNGHGIAGLHAALLYLEKTGIETIRKKELFLMRRFYEGVKDIPGVQVYGDFSENALLYRAPVVALNIGNYDSGEVADELASVYGIYTRAGAHCAPLMHRALGTVEQGAVRFSMSHYNKKEEIDEAIGAVRELSL